MIVGIVGPIASGKSMLSDELVKRGFIRLSFSFEVREEARNRGIPIERKALQDLGNEMRLKFGRDYWAKRIISKISGENNYAVEGIRNTSEVVALRELKDFILAAVDAPLEKRYQWIMMRGKDSDPHFLEGVKLIDARDRGEGEGEHGQQTSKCMEMADFHIMNDKTKEHFQKKLDKLFKKFIFQ